MWYNIKDLADLLKISTKTVRRRIKKNEWKTKEVQGSRGGKPIMMIYYELDNSQLDNSQLDNSQLDNSQLDNSETVTLRFYYTNDEAETSKEIEIPANHGMRPDSQVTCPDNCKFAYYGHPMVDGYKYCTLDFIKKFPHIVKVSSKYNIPCLRLISDDEVDTPNPLDFLCLSCKSAHPGCDSCCHLCQNPCNQQQICRLPKPPSAKSAKSAKSAPNKNFQDNVPSTNTQVPATDLAVAAPDLNPCPSVQSVSSVFHSSTQDDLPEEANQIARNRLIIVNRTLALTKEYSKTEAYQKVVTLYNAGLIAPELKEQQSSISIRTIQRWIKQFQFSGDYRDLAPRNKIKDARAISISDDERNLLLKLYLTQNKPSKGAVINLLKDLAVSGQINSPSSPRTLRRWLDRYESDHRDIVTFAREGQKALTDKLLPYIERDWTLIKPHDLWTLDGNILNFMIIYPPTGKAMRMMFVPVMDMASRAIIGASIGPTENTFNIARAVRAAMLNSNVAPRAILMDNGRANRSKFFGGKDLEKELCGLFNRLGTHEYFAKPYNGRAKPVERWFRTFNENLERFLEPYIGASIADKPARLMRNEKWHRKLINKEAITIQEAYQFIAAYVSKYNSTPHSALEGKTPLQVLSAAVIPPERHISEAELVHLMMKRQNLKVGRNGVHLLHAHYYEPHLTAHVGELVNVRYDFDSIDHVYVYSTKGKFLCRAPKVIATHPVTALSNSPLREEELKQQLKRNASISKKARQALENLSDSFQKADELIASASSASPKLELFDSPTPLPTPKKQQNSDSTIADLLPSSSAESAKSAMSKENIILNKENLGL